MKTFTFALAHILILLIVFVYCNSPFFAKGISESKSTTQNDSASTISESKSTMENDTATSLPLYATEAIKMIPLSEFRKHPDIILQGYADAYPDIIETVIKIENDWTVKLYDGSIYYWANGRLLPPEKKDEWENYRRYSIYPYKGTPRNPELYTPEQIERLRKRTTSDVRGAPQLPQEESFFDSLFDVSTRLATERHIKKTILFDMSVSVHQVLIPKLSLIDTEVKALAKTDTEVAAFLQNLSEIGGYNWRTVAGTNRRSNHSYGLALDVLPNDWGSKRIYWSWVRDFNNDWMLLSQEDLWTPPAKVIKIFENHGFIWGGTWDIYDTMHFEYRPELINLGKKIVSG